MYLVLWSFVVIVKTESDKFGISTCLVCNVVTIRTKNSLHVVMLRYYDTLYRQQLFGIGQTKIIYYNLPDDHWKN